MKQASCIADDTVLTLSTCDAASSAERQQLVIAV
jgi:hypothetical protein